MPRLAAAVHAKQSAAEKQKIIQVAGNFVARSWADRH
jgi:hypothetical protein